LKVLKAKLADELAPSLAFFICHGEKWTGDAPTYHLPVLLHLLEDLSREVENIEVKKGHNLPVTQVLNVIAGDVFWFVYEYGAIRVVTRSHAAS
jgi:hypothetical protein